MIIFVGSYLLENIDEYFLYWLPSTLKACFLVHWNLFCHQISSIISPTPPIKKASKTNLILWNIFKGWIVVVINLEALFVEKFKILVPIPACKTASSTLVGNSGLSFDHGTFSSYSNNISSGPSSTTVQNFFGQ